MALTQSQLYLYYYSFKFSPFSEKGQQIMTIKKILLPFLVSAIIIVAMAFTQTGKTKIVTERLKTVDPVYSYYFAYIGPSPAYSFSDYTDLNNYVLLDDQDPNEYCEYGFDAVCMITCPRVWNGFAWKPDFSYTSFPYAYWGLSQFFYYGYTGTGAVILKAL